MVLFFSSQKLFRSILFILFITQIGGLELHAQMPRFEKIELRSHQTDQGSAQHEKSEDELSFQKKLFWGMMITALLVVAIFIPIFIPFHRSHHHEVMSSEPCCDDEYSCEGFQVRGPAGICYSVEDNAKIKACNQERCLEVDLDGIPDGSYFINLQKGEIMQGNFVVSLDDFSPLKRELSVPSYHIWECLLSMKNQFFQDTSCMNRLEKSDRSGFLYHQIASLHDPLSEYCGKPDHYFIDSATDGDLDSCISGSIAQLQARAPSLAHQNIVFRLRYGEVGSPSFFVEARESLVIRADFAALWKYHFSGKRLSDHAIISMIAHELGHFIQNPKLLSYQGSSCSASSWKEYLSLNEELNADLIGQVLQVNKNNDVARSSAVAMLEFWRDDADQSVPDNVTIDADFDGFQKTIEYSGQHADGRVALKGPHPIWSVRIASLLELFEALKKIQLFFSEHSAKS